MREGRIYTNTQRNRWMIAFHALGVLSGAKKEKKNGPENRAVFFFSILFFLLCSISWKRTGNIFTVMAVADVRSHKLWSTGRLFSFSWRADRRKKKEDMIECCPPGDRKVSGSQREWTREIETELERKRKRMLFCVSLRVPLHYVVLIHQWWMPEISLTPPFF